MYTESPVAFVDTATDCVAVAAACIPAAWSAFVTELSFLQEDATTSAIKHRLTVTDLNVLFMFCDFLFWDWLGREGHRFGVWGLGFGVVFGLWFLVCGLEFEVWSLRFEVV
jgi:hypothetical protein